jgi:hypothetical protein
MQRSDPPGKLRLHSAAKRIGISYTTLLGLKERKEIGVEIVSPRNQFIYEAEVEAFLKRRKQCSVYLAV